MKVLFSVINLTVDFPVASNILSEKISANNDILETILNNIKTKQYSNHELKECFIFFANLPGIKLQTNLLDEFINFIKACKSTFAINSIITFLSKCLEKSGSCNFESLIVQIQLFIHIKRTFKFEQSFNNLSFISCK